MLEQASHTLISYSGRFKWLDRWLQHRQMLVASYCRMAQSGHGWALPSAEVIRHWCEELVDYLSTSHFKVFAELPGAHTAKIETLRVQLATTTQPLLDIQEALCHVKPEDLSGQQQLLSQLGEYLARQLEAEDRLLVETLDYGKIEVTS